MAAIDVTDNAPPPKNQVEEDVDKFKNKAEAVQEVVQEKLPEKPLDKLKSLFKLNRSKKPKASVPDPAKAAKQVQVKIKSYRGRTKFIIGGIVFVIVILVLAAFIPAIDRGVDTTIGLIPGLPNGEAEVSPTPSPTPVPQPPINLRPSAYANDPEVLSIEQEANGIDTDISKTSLRERQLPLPILDWDISF